MTLIADIIHDITANPAPVLFLDTCILLDVVRAPLRSKPDEVRFAQLFLTSVQKNPKTIHLLVPSLVQPEWDTHILERVNECTTAVNACNAVAAICGHLALPEVAALPAGVLKMPALLRQLSTDLLAACVTIDNQRPNTQLRIRAFCPGTFAFLAVFRVVVDNDGLALARAVDRIIAYRHPVKQPHSKGAKDSVILEHAVETTAQLRNAGFAEICIFVSSNTGDFANPGSTNLHAQLAASFNPVNLRYAVSLADAEGVLTAAGWVP